MPPQYKLRGYAGEMIDGAFYPAELQPVNLPETYPIEQVLRTRRRRDGRLEYLVKWRGYGPAFNSWVTDLEQLAP